ncbi:glycerol-1-phosphate dehydrogenase [NAD(P)+] [Methanolinea mesophila]|uniref:NAD(P)-dependent glycerol-1-phosphate dehydrogenase n=1 Tax=Methanolinea mesophila TaxID=547055 RepID=UPI001AE8F68D|nr:NAD(P)-dependent glycerol-1-phosphate dehydrogenase [Methanolinea mesophila]MBP1928240.1 glycerol-1-phosphate dehydrogenase [NAD(P)+] [Methanolinea mesophila]
MGTEGNKVLKSKQFDKSRWLQLPRDVVIGHDALSQIATVAGDLRLGSSVLVVTGSHTGELAGKKVISLLSGDYTVSTFVSDTLDMEVIARAEAAAEKADFLVGVGGGRVIDTAKIASYNTDRQFISVPTAASHDGIASARASVSSGDGNVSLQAHPPIAVVADTGVIAAAPHRLLASGCADIISNYTAILDWELAHRLRGEEVSEYALALSKMTAEQVMEHAGAIKPHQEETAWFVTKALVASGVAMSIAGSSRPASGGEHKFGHALERLAPGKALHGEACGIGTIITMYLHGGDWRAIRAALRAIGAPITPRDLGIEDRIFVEALLMAKTIRPERFTILDMGLSPEAAEDMVRMLYQE